MGDQPQAPKKPDNQPTAQPSKEPKREPLVPKPDRLSHTGEYKSIDRSKKQKPGK